MMRSSTACRIVRIKHTSFPPCIAEVETTLGERLPVFDAAVRDDLLKAMDEKTLILPDLWHSHSTPRGYIKTFYRIDPTLDVMPCPHCTETDIWNQRSPLKSEWHRPKSYLATMTRHDDGTPRFVCPRCSRRIYLQPVPKVEV